MVIALMSLGSVIAVSAENNNQKTNICHATGSQNNPWSAISISTSSLPTHLGHGDFLYTGPLKQNGTPSNDGDQWCKSHAPAQISAEKIICASEADLPNWGAGGADITAATAPDFLASHPNCYEQHGWKYQWAPASATNPGNNIEHAAGPWITFDENDLPEITPGQKVWVREELPSGYIPYSGATTNLNSAEAKNSAEFYCSTDVLNYDNYDSIPKVEAGKLYHCVAFNVLLDVCPNLDGAQATVPQGMHKDGQGNCVPDTATVHATKVVCDNEFDLPNWGYGGADIGPNTATDFVAGNSSCKIVPWTFEWAPTGTPNPGDNVEVAGAPWTPFSGGSVTVPAGSLVWLREQIPSAYQPFSGATTDLDGTNAKRSAEFYCSTDVLNYDNYDFISPVNANTDYYCVGFNTLKPEKADGKVHVFKFIDGVQATPEMTKTDEKPDGVSFPMFNAPYTQYPYYLGPYSDASAGDIPYESSTYNIVGGTAYTTQEDLSTPLVGASCSDENKPAYELVGYTTGKTFDEAKVGTPSKDAPNFTIDGDAYVIVWNHKCAPEVVDMCPNIEGNQTTIPEGYHLDDGDCVPDINQCVDTSGDVVSDTGTSFGEIAAKILSFIHDAWAAGTNAIPGASWIWGEDPVVDPTIATTETFTRTFSITGTPTGGSITIAADNDYAVSVNGTAICADGAQGTDGAGDSFGSPDTCTIPANVLVTGSNTLSITVTNWAVPGSTFESNPAGLRYKLHYSAQDCPDEEPLTGSIEIKKYLCPADFVPNRNDNGVGDAVPEGCSPQSGVAFGYVHGDQTDANGPYPELSMALTAGGSTGENGVLTIPGLVSAGRYLVKETDGTNLLGLYCEGDGDTNPNNNDNQELAFIPAGGIAHCVAYNKAPVVIVDMCPNIEGNQETVPQGMHKDQETGNCVPNIVVDAPQCSDGIDNGDEEDSLVDAADPACHSDGNVNNSESYTPSKNSESNDSAVCSDGKDNDSDGFIDSLDPGCQSGPDGAWNPSDTDESNSSSGPTGGGGGGNGGGGPLTLLPAGKVLGASTSCGLYLDDFLKMGKKNDKEQVKKLQQFLNDYLKLSPKLPVNGIFGVQTYKAVIKFQQQEKDLVLNPWVGVTLKDTKKGTGWVYKTTKTRINNIMCPELNLSIPPLTID